MTNLYQDDDNKKKQNKGREEERGRVISRQNVWGDEKVKRRRKVGESVNVKKNQYNLMSTIKNYIFFKIGRAHV